jgi:hypothetical protein
MTKTIFVTALIEIDGNRFQEEKFQDVLEHFLKMASTGINLCVYASSAYYGRIKTACEELHYRNVRMMECIELADTWFSAAVQGQAQRPLQMPAVRTIDHDTANFFTLINAKIEFVKRAMDATDGTHYAWIDFRISHVFRDMGASLAYLEMLGKSALAPRFTATPGCWVDGRSRDIFNHINWRFCGGFIIGDRTSMEEMWAKVQTHYPNFMRTTGFHTWEANFWTWLENHAGWNSGWYAADHDDSIIRIPSTHYSVVASLTTIPPRIESCKNTIDSLLGQVDHVYVAVSKYYRRFGPADDMPPAYAAVEPYKSRVTFVCGPDYGPASKYLGTLATIPDGSWIFVCDDDQVYHPRLIERMKTRLQAIQVYQNRHAIIRHTTDGGLIHGFVGNMVHKSVLASLPAHALTVTSRMIDDQWMSHYHYTQNTPIVQSGVEEYGDIYGVLNDGHECIGADALYSVANRRGLVKAYEAERGIRFGKEGVVCRMLTSAGDVAPPIRLNQGLHSQTVAYTPMSYPVLPGFEAMSAAHMIYNNVNILNVRYVNYTLTEHGAYIIHHPEGHIQTQNRMCVLGGGGGFDNIITSAPVNMALPGQTYSRQFEGLEDIRLFMWKGRPHYIATQRMWSPCGRNRMMLGSYQTGPGGPAITDGILLHPPTETACEKNWIPYVDPATDQLRIIYSWNPYSVGVIDANGKLRITAERHIRGLGRQLKGSTVPVHYMDGLLCVAHYSVESAPRIYMHLLVRLDPRSLMPTHMSAPFAFRRVGIEYCIGFHVDGASDMAHFWISEHDKEPGLVRAPMRGFSMKPI